MKWWLYNILIYDTIVVSLYSLLIKYKENEEERIYPFCKIKLQSTCRFL